MYFNRISINIPTANFFIYALLGRRRWAGLRLITINLPESYLKDLDVLVEDNLYPNRAEIIRTAVRDLLAEEVWDRKRRREDL